MLENTGGMDTELTANLGMQISLNVDVNRLARGDIPLNRKPLRISATLSDAIIYSFCPLLVREPNQRPDTIDIAEPSIPYPVIMTTAA